MIKQLVGGNVDGRDVPNVGNQYINSSISQVFAGYNFCDRIGLQFNLPVIYREYGYRDQRGSESGIGDVSLIGNFRLYEKETKKFTFNWTALGGLKFPTGDSAQLNPNQEDFANTGGRSPEGTIARARQQVSSEALGAPASNRSRTA